MNARYGDGPAFPSSAQLRVERQRTDDNMIPPPAQRHTAKRAGASVAKAKGSHAIDVSQPQALIKLIEQAAKST